MTEEIWSIMLGRHVVGSSMAICSHISKTKAEIDEKHRYSHALSFFFVYSIQFHTLWSVATYVLGSPQYPQNPLRYPQ